MIRIAVDAMGGDNAPAEIVQGAVLAARELQVEILLVGQEEVVRKHLGAVGGESPRDHRDG
jgi:glycerol-3-phosphate acyltransferase PlsX